MLQIFTHTQCYASTLYAVIVCSSVCPSQNVFCQND